MTAKVRGTVPSGECSGPAGGGLANGLASGVADEPELELVVAEAPPEPELAEAPTITVFPLAAKQVTATDNVSGVPSWLGIQEGRSKIDFMGVTDRRRSPSRHRRKSCRQGRYRS